MSACTPQPRWISKGRFLGRARLIMVWHHPLTFDPQGAFLCMCSVSFRGEWRTLNFTQSLPLFVLAMTYLKVFIRDKHWLFTLFLLLLPFWRANRRLIVNALTGAHLSLVSGNAGRRLAGCKCLTWSPSISCISTSAMVVTYCQDNQAQRGSVTGLRSHSWEAEASGFKPSLCGSLI